MQTDQDPAIVLDSTAFYAGLPFSSAVLCYTSPQILGEVSKGRGLGVKVSALMESGRLRIVDADKESLNKVLETAKNSTDTKLSNADISLLALAVFLRVGGREVTVVSDDYSIQNVASHLGLKFSSVMTQGIGKTVKWIVYCSGCGKSFSRDVTKRCDVCGTEIKRKFGSNRPL